MPTKLRHCTKDEDSNELTDDEDQYALQEAEMNKEDGDAGGFDFMISGSAIDTSAVIHKPLD